MDNPGVIMALVAVLLGMFFLISRAGSARREGRRRPADATGVYPGGVYPLAADTGSRDGRGGDGGGPIDPTPDAGSDGGHAGGGGGGDGGGDG